VSSRLGRRLRERAERSMGIIPVHASEARSVSTTAGAGAGAWKLDAGDCGALPWLPIRTERTGQDNPPPAPSESWF
jgi:hypothetical protein